MHYSQLAEIEGLSRARITQIMNLLLLSPPIQETILMLSPQEKKFIMQRKLRKIVKEPE